MLVVPGVTPVPVNVISTPCSGVLANEALDWRTLPLMLTLGLSTVVVVLAVLFPGFGSEVSSVAIAADAPICVPFAVLGSTFTTTVKTEFDPAAIDAFRQDRAKFAVVWHDQPEALLAETNVVPVGRAMVSPTFTASLGPLFVAVTVYVIFSPARTGSGVSVIVTERSAEVIIVVDADAELFSGFASLVSEVIDAVFVITVPAAMFAGTVTKRVKA
jgi:hypothetical protein